MNSIIRTVSVCHENPLFTRNKQWRYSIHIQDNRHRKAYILLVPLGGASQMQTPIEQRLISFMWRSIKPGFHSNEQTSLGEICDSVDDTLFHAITTNPSHPLYEIPPSQIVQRYDLRKRVHQFQLPTNGNGLLDEIILCSSTPIQKLVSNRSYIFKLTDNLLNSFHFVNISTMSFTY